MMKHRKKSVKCSLQKRRVRKRYMWIVPAVLLIAVSVPEIAARIPVMALEAGSSEAGRNSEGNAGNEGSNPNEESTGNEENTGDTVNESDTNGKNSSETTEPPATDAVQNTEAPDNTPQSPSENPPAVVIPDSTEEEKPNHAPKVIVSACRTDLERIEPGMDVNFTVSLKNTSTEKMLYNMKVSYESATGDLTPIESTNSRYISRIGVGGGSSFSFPMHISRDITSYSQKIIINLEYEDEQGMSYTTSESIYANIFRPLGFHTDTPIVPAAVESGTTATISLNLFNTGKATIYDVYCRLECRGFLESGTCYVGNMASETSATVSLLPVASNLQYGPLGNAQGDKYGKVSGKIIITYQDEAGNSYEEEVAVNTEITMPASEVKEPEIEEIKYSSQWWISIVILLILIDGLVIFLTYYIRKHRV